MNPYVKSVRPQEDYQLWLTFENGEKRIFDVKLYLDKGVFIRLKKVAEFKTARVVSGSVEWRGEIDLSNDTLYLASTPAQTGKVRSKKVRRTDKKVAAVHAKRPKQRRASAGAK